MDYCFQYWKKRRWFHRKHITKEALWMWLTTRDFSISASYEDKSNIMVAIACCTFLFCNEDQRAPLFILNITDDCFRFYLFFQRRPIVIEMLRTAILANGMLAIGACAIQCLRQVVMLAIGNCWIRRNSKQFVLLKHDSSLVAIFETRLTIESIVAFWTNEWCQSIAFHALAKQIVVRIIDFIVRRHCILWQQNLILVVR